MIKEYVYCVKNPTDGNSACVNPKVIFKTKVGQAVPCRDKPGCITIVVPDGVDACVEGHIICQDCGKCPPKPFKICPCSDSSDCTDCEKCVGGLCVDLCAGKCDQGTCVDCTHDSECTLGKVCKNGKCECPAGKNLINERGECVACITDGNCGKCQVCYGGECIAKECDGTCDPNTGNCVDCINSGNCIGRIDGKECCKGLICDCCEGYVFNLALNRCVVKPECTLDIDCKECEICVAGVCQPRICPQGTICIKDKCIEICDCNNPTCDRTSTCIRYNASTCICSKCEGSCTDSSSCGEGCYCNKGVCSPNPCNKVCTSGSDCGPGCGCKDNKCIPCDSLTCPDNCNTVDGCKCYGTSCQGDPCNGPCNSGLDCGEGCGCLNGTCISCDKLTCDQCANAINCKCTNGLCKSVTRCTGNCVSSFDCGPGCICHQGECVNCESFNCATCPTGCNCASGICSAETRDCENKKFKVEKIDCTFKASLDKTAECSCDQLQLKSELTKISGGTSTVLGLPTKDYTFVLGMYKSGILIPSIDYPLNGTIKLTIKTFYIYDGVTYNVTSSQDGTYDSTKNELTYTITVADKVNKNGYNVTGYEIIFDQISNINLPNGCTYKPILLRDKKYTSLFLGMTEDTNIVSDDVRAPLFNWYRGSSDSSQTTLVKTVYAQNGGNIWFDYISSCEDGFCSGYYYKVTSDCGCVTDSNPLKAIFCPNDLGGAYAMSNFKYVLTNCNKTFTLTDIFNNCPINGLLGDGCNCPTNAQVEWILKIYTEDGLSRTERFKYNLASEILSPAPVFTFVKGITRVTLEHSQDPTCKYDKNHTAGVDLVLDSTCSTRTITATTGVAACEVKLYDGVTLITTGFTDLTGRIAFSGLTLGTDYTVYATCGACEDNKHLKLDCCVGGTTAIISGSYNPTNSTTNANITPGNSSLTYVYSVNGLPVASGGTFSEVLATPLSNGVYPLSAIDSNGCTYGPINYTIDNCPNTTISIDVTYDSTIGLEEININNILGNGVSPYTINVLLGVTNITTLTNVSSFPVNINANAYVDGTYTIKVTDANNCSDQTSLIVQKGLACSLNPADINASRSNPQLADCPPNVNTKIWVNNAFAPYSVETYRNNTLVTAEGFLNLGNSSSGNILYNSTLGLNDEYNVSNLIDGLYTFKVIDSRGCTDIVEVKIECNCAVPISVDTQGIICQGASHALVINSITGGQNPGNYVLNVYEGGTCLGTLFIQQAVNSSAITIPIPVVNQQIPGGQYSLQITSGNCTTSCITLNSPDCTGFPCMTGLEAFYRGEIDCNGILDVGTWKVKMNNNSGVTVTWELYRLPFTNLGLCPNGINCNTGGYTFINSGNILNGGTACQDNISAIPDGTACFLVKFINFSDPTCEVCMKPIVNFSI